jgi:hypothetical protein
MNEILNQAEVIFQDDQEYREFFYKLADLTLEAPTFEVAQAALRLQAELKKIYGSPDLV